ncbi:MAG: YeiH family protein [Candidatus Pristimantibacillus sp.]
MDTLTSHYDQSYDQPDKRQSRTGFGFFGGLLFTVAIAWVAFELAKLPGLDRIGQMAIALIGAVLYRQAAGYPERLRPGIQFSSKQLLRLAIILFGLKLNIGTVFQQGWELLLQGVVTVAFSIGMTLWLAKKLKADFSLSLLLGIGTGVCGAAAIGAVSPIVKARDDDTAISVGLIALIGTIFAIGYTLLQPILPLSNEQYGIWAGISLHEIAHVALAADPAGQDAIAIALLAKLGRVFLLVPLSLILMFVMKRRGKIERGTKITFPWFLLGFVAMSILGSLIAGTSFAIPEHTGAFISQATTFLLTMAMVGLGLNVDLKALRTKALRPLIAMTITSVILSLLSLLFIV